MPPGRKNRSGHRSFVPAGRKGHPSAKAVLGQKGLPTGDITPPPGCGPCPAPGSRTLFGPSHRAPSGRLLPPRPPIGATGTGPLPTGKAFLSTQRSTVALPRAWAAPVLASPLFPAAGALRRSGDSFPRRPALRAAAVHSESKRRSLFSQQFTPFLTVSIL